MDYGLLGRKLGHSYSPEIHRLLGGYEYGIFEREPDELESFFKEKSFKGINVTIPYKVRAMDFCDELSETARRIGCVNTIVRREDGSLFGHNTDYEGFVYLVRHSGIRVEGKQCLVLGTGGASKTVCIALKDLGASRVLTVSRTGRNNYTNVYNHSDAEIIVNATPVGMYPDCDEKLLNVIRFQRLMGLIDLIYNPAHTMLMLQAEKDYVHCENGLRMLVSQAAASSELFTGSSYSEDDVERIYRSIDFEMKNILLIGMPGCGKSTVGKLLAEKLNRELLDTDEEIEKRTGRSPAEIIKTDGEPEFRRIETEVLRDISILSGKIISCGGGIISPKENRGLLRRNSNVVWLQREISSLVSEGRPLSQIIGNRELYRYREPLYMESAEYVVNNDGDVNDTVNKIIEAIGR